MKFVLLLLAIAVCVQGASYNRKLLETKSAEEYAEDIENQFTDFVERMWGKKCVTDGMCQDTLAYCMKETTLSMGECRPVWWTWLVLALIAVVLASACVACICCPCCFLYACCSAILDCVCCCCRNKGYSPANRG